MVLVLVVEEEQQKEETTEGLGFLHAINVTLRRRVERHLFSSRGGGWVEEVYYTGGFRD